MKFVPSALIYIFAIFCCHAALIPIDSSSSSSSSTAVNVKNTHTGQQYSYSIHENKAFAIDPNTVAIIHNPSFIKTALVTTTASDDGGHQHETEGIKKKQDEHQSDGGVQKIAIKTGDYATAAVAVYPTLPLIQPYAYVHGFAYPYNLVAV